MKKGIQLVLVTFLLTISSATLYRRIEELSRSFCIFFRVKNVFSDNFLKKIKKSIFLCKTFLYNPTTFRH